MAQWTSALALDDLPPGQAKLFRHGDFRVALFRLADGDVFAVDNACPHEGYPLVQGEVKNGVLTCAWHNFKFQLGSGACLKGDEDVRAYATRVRDGQVEVDLTPEDPARRIQAARTSLADAVREGQEGRMARDAARLLRAGWPAALLLAEGAKLDARISEYGTSHALPVATDLLTYLRDDPARDTLVAAHLFQLVSDPSQRRPDHTWPAPAPIDPATWAADLDHAVEDEDADRAIALVRGARAASVSREELETALLTCASRHFLGFGHGLIYTTKVFELLRAVPDAAAEDILAALTLRLVSSTREDTLPPLRRWRTWVDAHGDTLQAAWDRRGEASYLDADALDGWATRILDPTDDTVETEFLALLPDTHPGSLVDVVVVAAARRLLRFDPAVHTDWTHQDNWLFVTHPLTHAHAIRDALAAEDRAPVLTNLVWSLAFVRRNHKLDQAGGGPRITPDAGATVGDIVDGLARRDAEATLSAAAGWLAHGGDPGELEPALQDWLLTGPAVRPIHIAHNVKTARVGLQEASTLPDPVRAWPLLGALRYLAHPVGERNLQALAHDAVELVYHGRLPRRLAP